MAAHRGSEAYDLSLFEPKPAKIVQIKPNKKMLKEQKRKQKIQSMLNTVATLSVAAVVISVLGLMIASRVRLTELDQQISKREAQMVVLQSENTRLTDELARKISTKSVEDYARDTLGMQKIESSQIEYIAVEDGDRVDMLSSGNMSILDTIASSISKFFSQLTYLFQ